MRTLGSNRWIEWIGFELFLPDLFFWSLSLSQSATHCWLIDWYSRPPRRRSATWTNDHTARGQGPCHHAAIHLAFMVHDSSTSNGEDPPLWPGFHGESGGRGAWKYKYGMVCGTYMQAATPVYSSPVYGCERNVPASGLARWMRLPGVSHDYVLTVRTWLPGMSLGEFTRPHISLCWS